MENSKKEKLEARPSMQVASISRLLGMTTTLFILILTVKAELLHYKAIAWQLSLAIPLLFASLIVSLKIIDENSFQEHRLFSLYVNSISFALIINVIGLLVTKYVSATIGFVYFLLFISIYIYFLAKDWKYERIHNEIIVLIILIVMGLIPAYTILA